MKYYYLVIRQLFVAGFLLLCSTAVLFGADSLSTQNAPNKDVERIYARNHFSCMQQGLIGAIDACGTTMRALEYFEKKQIAYRFRIIHASESIPNSLYVVRKRVPEADRMIIKKTILGLAKSKAGQELLKNSNFANYVEAKDAEYNIVREMS
mgnify:CR=1 FL=1